MQITETEEHIEMSPLLHCIYCLVTHHHFVRVLSKEWFGPNSGSHLLR